MDLHAPDWKRTAVAAGRAAGLAPAILALLDVFGAADEVPAAELRGPAPPPTGRPDPPDVEAVAAALAGEVDPAQAAMFARRVAAARTALGPGPADTLLRALLDGRLAGVLASPRPRALRVRALADFVYSQHARISLGDPAGPTPAALAVAAGWRQGPDGVAFATVTGRTTLGPQRLHLLRLDPAHLRLRCVDRRGAAGDLAAHSLRLGAVAALSGGFFLYSEPDIGPHSRRTDPVGLLVDGGRVASAPLLPRSALLQDIDGAWRIAAPGLTAARLLIGGRPVALASVQATTRSTARRAPAGPGEAIAIVGDRIVGRAGPGQPLDVPLHGVVLRFSGPAPRGPVTWAMPGVDAAMAGGPRLVADGRALTELAAAPVPAPQLVAEGFCGTAPPRTFSQDETGDRNLLPRLGVGLDADGRLLAVAADGRDLAGALGLTLSALGEVLAALGCRDALNLDGGSSKRMVVAGRTVDQASTELHGRRPAASQPEPSRRRPVHTAIFALPRAAAG